MQATGTAAAGGVVGAVYATYRVGKTGKLVLDYRHRRSQRPPGASPASSPCWMGSASSTQAEVQRPNGTVRYRLSRTRASAKDGRPKAAVTVLWLKAQPAFLTLLSRPSYLARYSARWALRSATIFS